MSFHAEHLLHGLLVQCLQLRTAKVKPQGRNRVVAVSLANLASDLKGLHDQTEL